MEQATITDDDKSGKLDSTSIDGGDDESKNVDDVSDGLGKSESIEIDVDDVHNADHSKYIWLHAFYHSVVVCVGTGILGLPHATAYMGYAAMVFLITFITMCSFYAANLLIVVQSPSEGTYSEVAEAVMGRKFAIWCVRPIQFLQFFLVAPVFIVIGAQGMITMDGMTGENRALPEKGWTIVMGVVVLALSFVPDMSKAWQLSLFGFVAAVMIALYSIVGSGVVIASGSNNNEDDTADFYGRPPNNSNNPDIGFAMGVLSSFGSILFAFGYHIVIPDIHASLHDHATTDAHADMKKATVAAFMFAYPAYLMSALVGYAAFGSTVNGEILISLNEYLSAPAMYVIWVFVIVKISTEASVFNQCAFTLFRDIIGLTIESDHVDHHPRNKWIDSLIRVVWMIIATLIAMFVPVFSDLSSIGASLTITPLSFIIPIILWNKKNEGNVSKKRLVFHTMFMTLFVIFGIMGLTGSVYDLLIMLNHASVA